VQNQLLMNASRVMPCAIGYCMCSWLPERVSRLAVLGCCAVSFRADCSEPADSASVYAGAQARQHVSRCFLACSWPHAVGAAD
jgi:hypothetical protein